MDYLTYHWNYSFMTIQFDLFKYYLDFLDLNHISLLFLKTFKLVLFNYF